MNFAPSALTNALRIRHPLIVAPMAGGPSSVELVVATSEAGALGSIAGAYLDPLKIESQVRATRANTDSPFAVNLFAPAKQIAVAEDRIEMAKAATKKYRDELGLPDRDLAPPFEEAFDRQFEAVLRGKAKIFSFTFGCLDSTYMRALREAGVFVIGTATTPDEAFELVETGFDAVVAQGFEAGGHRGIFDAFAADPGIGTLELIKAIKLRTKTFVIGAGGIMDSASIRSAIEAGADAVQMGTAFLATEEAGTPFAYKQRLLNSTVRKTRLTRAFSGRLARGLVKRFVSEIDELPDAILPYPAQNKFTRDIRTASNAINSAEFVSLWSGMGSGSLSTGTVRDLIQSLFA